jgi:HlyD family secretion protein
MGGGMGGSSQDATKFEVKIRIKDKAAFRPGMTVTADIETRSRTNVLTVPIASVTTRLPKPPAEDKRGRKKATNEVARAAAGASGGSALAAAPTANTNAPTTTTAATTTSTTAANTTNIATAAPTGTNAISSGTGTNAAGVVSGKKPGEKPKPIEVVFLKVSERAKMLPVKLGISDDSYTEITEGVAEGDEVISGGFKAISKELEDEKKVRIGKPVADEKEKGKEPEKK